MGKINIKQKAKLAAAKRKKEEAEGKSSNPFDLGAPVKDPSIPTAEDFENKSVISFKALHGVAKSKKEKLKLRKKLWHEKIELCKGKSGKNNPAKRKSRGSLEEATGFQLLLDSLPAIDRAKELNGSKQSQQPSDQGQAKQKRKTEKQRHREMLKNIETFNQVLQHPEFQKSPMDTMLEHLRNKNEMEKNGELPMEEEQSRPVAKRKRNRRKRRNAECEG